MQIDLDYGTTFVGDLEGRCLDENPQGRPTAVEIRVGDTWTTPTPRFWKSFAHRFHVSENVFRYFEPDEVFGRVAERNADDLYGRRPTVHRDGLRLGGRGRTDRPGAAHESVIFRWSRILATIPMPRRQVIATTNESGV